METGVNKKTDLKIKRLLVQRRSLRAKLDAAEKRREASWSAYHKVSREYTLCDNKIGELRHNYSNGQLVLVPANKVSSQGSGEEPTVVKIKARPGHKLYEVAGQYGCRRKIHEKDILGPLVLGTVVPHQKINGFDHPASDGDNE